MFHKFNEYLKFVYYNFMNIQLLYAICQVVNVWQILTIYQACQRNTFIDDGLHSLIAQNNYFMNN